MAGKGTSTMIKFILVTGRPTTGFEKCIHMCKLYQVHLCWKYNYHVQSLKPASTSNCCPIFKQLIQTATQQVPVLHINKSCLFLETWCSN